MLGLLDVTEQRQLEEQVRAAQRLETVGLLAGFAADRVWGDPERGHPVAVFGALASGLERRLYVDDRRAGVVYTAALVGAQTSDRPLPVAPGREITIEGEVVDFECYLRDGSRGQRHKSCALTPLRKIVD